MMATRNLFPANKQNQHHYILFSIMNNEPALPLDHDKFQMAITTLFQVIEKFYEGFKTVDILPIQYHGKKIFQKFILQNKGNLGDNYEGYIGQVIKTIHTFKNVPYIQSLQDVLPSELRVLNIIPNENLDFLNQETPYQVAEPLRGGLPPHKFEAILRTIHLVSTRRETFNKSSGCLCWTGVSIAKEFDQNLNVELNSNQKNMMISVQAYSSLKSYLMDDKE